MNHNEMAKISVAAASVSAQQNYGLAAAQEQRPEGNYTSRVRQLAELSERNVQRLARLLLNLRGNPPPMPVESGSMVGLRAGMPSMNDHLGQHESAQNTVDQMIGELEGLL